MNKPWSGSGILGRKRRHARFFDLASKPTFESRIPARFATHQDFAAFVEGTRTWAGGEPSFRVFYPSGHDIVGAFSVEDIFRISHNQLDFLSVFTLAGEMRFDYRYGPLIQVFPAKGHEEDVAEWVCILQRHLRPVAWHKRFIGYSLATKGQ